MCQTTGYNQKLKSAGPIYGLYLRPFSLSLRGKSFSMQTDSELNLWIKIKRSK